MLIFVILVISVFGCLVCVFSVAAAWFVWLRGDCSSLFELVCLLLGSCMLCGLGWLVDLLEFA